MRTLVVALIGAVAFASGVMLGFKLDSDDTAAAPATTGTPRGRRGDARCARSRPPRAGDYEALRALIPTRRLRVHLRRARCRRPDRVLATSSSRTTDERPLETLAVVLELPYVLSRGYYVWPWAYTVASRADLSQHERELLAPLGTPDALVLDGTGYLGWRAGIAPDGTWSFFVAGD